ncbi:MAG: PQQ-like beta-propeller repeat protein [Myxococcales bacterium]|nr:PQQ-like beta-propeller repeat protein [Myxococcales bacterium]
MLRRGASLSLGLVLSCAPRALPPRAQVDVPVRGVETHRRSSPPNPPACPELQAEEGYPPWHRGLVKETCVRGARGRWQVRADDSDPDGWRHWLDFTPTTGSDAKAFSVEVVAPMALALRSDGAAVVVDLKDRVSLIAPDGELVWRKAFPRCGYAYSVAIDYDHHISVNCGYSLLHFEPDGQLAYQKWPFGNHSLGGPWVDRDGTLYLSGEGTVVALNPHGKEIWRVSTGFNRALSQLGWLPSGDMVFDTSMAELHSNPEQTHGLRIYWQEEPPELFVISRTGKIVSREQHDGEPTRGWPEALPYPEDGSHRIPEP